MEDKRLKQLVQRYLDGVCTPEELAALQEILRDSAYQERLEALLGEAWQDGAEGSVPRQDERSADEILRRILAHDRQKRPIWLSRWSIAATVVLIVSISALFYLRFGAGLGDNQSVVNTPLDADPGTYKAELSYDGGKPLLLKTSQEGIVMTERGVSYIDGTGVDLSAQGKPVKESYYELRTPHGGSYQVTLPDGTHVWLNAQTTLRYPACFASDARIVMLTGEAYFDVAKKKDDNGRVVPFSVITDQQNVHVLGTEFNLKAYPDEALTTTTLIEGRVRVERPVSGESEGGAAVILSPGQEAITSGTDDGLVAREAEASIVGAWKDGLFVFNDEPLEKIMQRLSRWYDIEMSYKGGAEHIRFTGNYAMDKSLRNLLEHITLTEGIRFETVGNSANERRIIAIKD